jgi:hypothetical protein
LIPTMPSSSRICSSGTSADQLRQRCLPSSSASSTFHGTGERTSELGFTATTTASWTTRRPCLPGVPLGPASRELFGLISCALEY